MQLITHSFATLHPPFLKCAICIFPAHITIVIRLNDPRRAALN